VTTSQPARQDTRIQSSQSTLALVRRGALAGGAASVVTTAGAAIARAAGVSLEVDAAAIPVAAFALWTLVGAALVVR
jgi:hypothetical protein